MYIKRLYIKNFRNIEEKEWLPTSKVNFLMGENATGKSSFLKAFRFALTGVVEREDVRDGATSTYVEVELDDGTVFSREVFALGIEKPNKVRVNGKATTLKGLNQVLERFYEVPVESMKVVTAKEVGSLTPPELLAIILPYLPEKLTVTDVKAQASKTLSGKQTELLCSFFPPLPNDFDLNEIAIAYAKASDERRLARKELDAIITKSKWESDIPTRTLADVDREYKLYLAEEAKDSSSASDVAAYNNAVKRKKEIEEKIALLEKELSAISISKPNPVVLKNLLNEKDTLQHELSDVRVVIGALEMSIAQGEDTLANLSSSSCPLCEQLVCTTDKTCVRKEIEDILKCNKEALCIQKAKLEEISKKIEEVEAKIVKYGEDEKLYNKKLLLISQIDGLRSSIPTIPAKPASVTKRDFSKEKAALDAERKQIQLYNATLEAASKIDGYKEIFDNLDVVCSELAPKGTVCENITEYYVGILNDEINNVATTMRSDYAFSFYAENGLGLKFKTKASALPRVYEYLSESEKTIMSFFVLHFINTLSGFKTLILDDLNHLDKKSFEDLMKVVFSPDIQDFYDTIIFASVVNPDLEDVLSSYSSIVKI